MPCAVPNSSCEGWMRRGPQRRSDTRQLRWTQPSRSRRSVRSSGASDSLSLSGAAWWLGAVCGNVLAFGERPRMNAPDCPFQQRIPLALYPAVSISCWFYILLALDPAGSTSRCLYIPLPAACVFRCVYIHLRSCPSAFISCSLCFPLPP